MPSFDVISKIDLHELDNALNQARKEISTRYDFQGTRTELQLLDGNTGILIKSESEGRVSAAYEVLLTKLAKRGVSVRAFTSGEMDSKALGVVKQTISMQQGIPVEKAKELIKLLKESKLKVQGSIQGDQLRITGKNRDDLQAAIAQLRAQQEQLKLDMQFTNFRE
ncbi:MAG: YajQ family cyclic di-GMP-binding protein [Myxococcota bacterium]|nr:YajQ family cyclic di-GMP-binding protein [Myxococcota bacterium]